MEEPRNEMETFSSIQYKAAKYDDKLVLVRDCMTGQKGITCLDCRKDLVVKKGNIKQHHFAHAKGSLCSAYSGYTGKGGETMEHYRAKAKIAERFNNAVKLQIMRRLCIGCSKNEMITDLAVYKQNGYFACVEFPYIDMKGNTRKADVAVVDNSGNCHFIVEIKQTHATPESNREGCSWVELCASSVNNNTDDTFICIRCPNRYCADCVERIMRWDEQMKGVMQRRLEREREQQRIKEEQEMEELSQKLHEEWQEKWAKEYNEKKISAAAVALLYTMMIRRNARVAYIGTIRLYKRDERMRKKVEQLEKEQEKQRIKKEEEDRVRKQEQLRVLCVRDIAKLEKLVKKELPKCSRCSSFCCFTCRALVAKSVKSLRSSIAES